MRDSGLLINTLLALALVSLLWISLPAIGSPYLTSATFTAEDWSLLIHRTFNTTFWWHTSAPLQQTVGTFTAAAVPLAAVILSCMIALMNMRGENTLSRPHLLVLSTIPALLLLFLFGEDSPTFMLTAQLGMTLLSCALLRTGIGEHLPRGIIMAAASGVFLVVFLTPLSTYLILALGAAAFTSTTDNRQNSQQKALYLLMALLVTALWLAINGECLRPSIPDFGYPPNARVVPDDGVAGNILPLIGETTPIPYINRPYLKETFTPLALTLFALSLLTVIGRNFPRRFISLTAVALTTCLLLDTIPADPLSTLAPLETARRILPGLFPLTLLSATCALSIVVLWTIMARSPARLLLAAACLLTGLNHPGALNGLPEPFSAAHSGHPVMTSPSLDLLREEGFETLAVLEKRPDMIPVNIAEIDGTVTVSHQRKIKSRKMLSDGRMETRWSPRRGAQYGDEWVQVNLPQPLEIRGVQALPGKFFSDFPRGLTISDCQEPAPAQPEIRVIPEWQGGLALTPSGYPYYTGQHDVNILFRKPIVTSCIKISQTAESEHYDWSIAELRLLRTNPSHAD